MELELGLDFPPDARQFLRDFAGVRPGPNDFEVGGTRYGLGHINNLKEISALKKSLDEFNPSTMIPIASDAFGNYFCVETRGQNAGAVYFVDHEIAGGDAFSLLAASLPELLSMAQPSDPEQIPFDPSKVISVWVRPGFLESLKKS